MHKLIVLAFLLASVPSAALPLSELRAQYLEGPVKVMGLMEVPELSYSFVPERADQLHEVRYKPNSRLNYGIGIGYDGIGANFTLPMPREGDEVARKGNTRHFDLALHRYWAWGGVDLLYGHYKGFYREDESKNEGNDTYIQRPDVRLDHIALNYIHVFRPGSYRLEQETTGANEATSVSGGSPLGLLGINRVQIHGDRVLLEPSDGLTLEDKSRIRAGRFDSASLGGGYGYNWVWAQHQLGGWVLLGVGPQWQRLSLESNTSTRRTELSLKQTLGMSYTFERNAWRFGFTTRFENVESDLGSADLESELLSFQLFATTEI